MIKGFSSDFTVHRVGFFKDKFSREKYEKDIEAVRNEDDSSVLADFALNNDFSNVRLEATNRIEEESVLVKVALNDSNKKVRKEAIRKIHNEFVLADIASNDSGRSIRQAASERLYELGYR